MQCFLCHKNFKLDDLIQHIKLIHARNVDQETLQCTKCLTIHSNLISYRRHLKNCLNNTCQIAEEIKIVDTVNEQNSIPKPTGKLELCDAIDHIENINVSQKELDLSLAIKTVEKATDNFVMTLLSHASLNRKLVQEIIMNVDQLQQNTFEIIKPYINETLAEDDSSRINSLLQSAICTLSNANYKTEHRRTKYLKKLNLLIPPNAYLIGNHLHSVTKKNITTIKTSVLEGQHISIYNTFKLLFEIPDVLQQAKNYVYGTRDNTQYKDFIDGALWKKLKQPFLNKTVFPLIMFFDDFECGDVLGSHSGINCIGGTYITPKCFDPTYLSQLVNIFPTLLFHTLDRTKFGNRMAFAPIIRELTQLETSGIEIVINNKSETIFFVLGLIIGDNKGCNSILGFTESFVSSRCCRFCTADRDTIRKLTVQCNDILRTVDQYDENTANINVPETGIKQTCVFNDIPSFHVVSNYSVDSMHDILEGILLYVMAKINYNLIYVKNIFTLDFLNSKIKCFNYGHLINSNKPSSITKEHLQRGYLRMSASESLLFVKTFRFFVGHLIPNDNDEWKLYLKILEIVNIIFSNTIPKACVQQLKILIQEHNEMYIALFGNLKPKFHFLIHYPTVIQESGPPKHFSALRFESKHSELKTISSSIKSRINLPKSIATRYQLKLSNRFLKQTGIRSIETYSKLKLIKNDKFFCANSYEVLRYSNHGKTYYINSIICIEKGDIWPKFAKIKRIVVKPKLIFFVKQINILYFDEHFLAFLVVDNSEMLYKSIVIECANDLPTLYHMYQCNLNQYIC
jgi:hypothetical protein